VFVEPTEQALLSQTHAVCRLLPQQIERNVPHRNPMFGRLVLPDAAALFMEDDL